MNQGNRVSSGRVLAWLLMFVVSSAGVLEAQRSTFPSPAGYWSFDLCETASPFRTWDAARVTHHGNLLNGAACNAFGRYGSSGFFDGTDNLVEVPYSADLNVGNAMTIAAWVYPQNLAKWQTIANKWFTPDSWGLFLEPSGRYNFTVALPGGNKTATAAATVNTWTHVAGVYDGANVRIYVNGVQIGAAVPATGNAIASTRPIAIGSHPSWNAMQGYIDEVKFYKQALSAAQVAALAATPVGVGTRGLHLNASQWICEPALYGPDCNADWVLQQKDLDYIHSIGNINSIKTSIWSYKVPWDPNTPTYWMQRQNEKLSWLFSATGNHTTWIVRVWPYMCEFGQFCDCPKDAAGNRDYFNCGYNFAASLASPGGGLPSPLGHLVSTLKVKNLFLEVANEPNLADEGFNSSSANYNDFFRGFYFGERAYGFSIPLVYAGLSPGCNSGGTCTADAWYQDFWVRDHIQNYAAKIGVHVYWDSPTTGAWNGRLSETGGLYYRRVRNQLAPAVSPRGIQITEFNVNRANAGMSTEAQAVEVCNWWKQEAIDAGAGWWVEQATIFITEHAGFTLDYSMTDNQIDNIRTCQ